MAAKQKSIAGDVFGELLETGKQTAKAGAKAASDITKQTAKTVLGQSGSPKTPKTDKQAGLDWLEKNIKAAQQTKVQKPAKNQDDVAKQQVDRMKAMDAKQSKQKYEEIQRQIQMVRRQKQAQPRKYETGKTGYDETQYKDPETFWDKVKKKQEEMSKKMPWSSKKGQGTGEIRRGVSG